MLKLSLEMSKMHLSRINLGDRFICHLTGSDERKTVLDLYQKTSKVGKGLSIRRYHPVGLESTQHCFNHYLSRLRS